MPGSSVFKSEVRRKKEEGFTIVELLVSIGIITVITGVMLANFRSGSQASELRFAADILTNQLREAQTSALAARLASICSGGADNLKTCGAVACTGGTCQSRVSPGYGVHLGTDDPKNLTLFFDGNDNGRYDVGEERAKQPLVSTGAVVFDSSTVTTPVDITFRPPSAEIGVNGLVTPPDTVVITLKHPAANITRRVTVYRISGKIEHD